MANPSRQVQIWADPSPSGEPVYRGTVFVRDGKNENRPRTVPVTDGLCRDLLAACAGKGPDEPVFRLSYAQLDIRWRRVCEVAELKGVRFKDLRAQTAIYAERAGIPLTLISQHLGHGDESTTRRYQRHSATLTNDHAAALASALGLGATATMSVVRI